MDTCKRQDLSRLPLTSTAPRAFPSPRQDVRQGCDLGSAPSGCRQPLVMLINRAHSVQGELLVNSSLNEGKGSRPLRRRFLDQVC